MVEQVLRQGGPPNRVLIRYGELVLRGRNLRVYEEKVVDNVRARLADFQRVTFARMNGRLLIQCTGDMSVAVERAKAVFGIHSVSPCVQVPAEMDRIRSCTLQIVDEAQKKRGGRLESFRMDVRRSDKRFPSTSMEINRELGSLVQEVHPGLRVDLDHAELVVGVEIRRNSAFLFGEKIRGVQGMPVGTAGKVVCLFSGGIDSPVAAYMAMKRGCEVILVNFHSYPFTGLKDQETTLSVARRLSMYQPKTRLHMVPLTEVQKAVRDHSKENYRIILYRRAMMRIATTIASQEGAKALITGECLSQVASQTLENMSCIAHATPLEVYRPLIGFDKVEIMDLARKIGTFDLSHCAEGDCCTVFAPKWPVLRSRIEFALDMENSIASRPMEEAAREDHDVIEFDCLGAECRKAEEFVGDP